MKWRRLTHNHLIGTEVQTKSGRVQVKVGDLDGAKWVGRGRHNYMKAHKVDLDQNQRVYHMDGDIANDDPKNLVAIRFSGVRYNLTHSKVVWAPPKPKKVAAYIPKRKPLPDVVRERASV